MIHTQSPAYVIIKKRTSTIFHPHASLFSRRKDKTGYHPPFLLLLNIRNLQHRLPEVLSVQHAEEGIDGVLDADIDVRLGLEGAIVDPLLQLLLVLDSVLGTHVRVGNDEAAHRDALGRHHEQVRDAVALLGCQVVLRDHAAGD